MRKMINGKDYFYSDTDSQSALTLDPSEVCEGWTEANGTGKFTCTHDSGWTITGTVREDYYYWVNDFEAEHPVLGRVSGNFEGTVMAQSRKAFKHFLANHPPQSWDYGNI